MRNPFSRMFSRLTINACASCESGSGAFYNAETGELTRCASCSGSGLEGDMAAAPIVDLALVRSARAKEQRRVA